MHESRESELLERIQLLEQRIQELELKSASNKDGLDGTSIFVEGQSKKSAAMSYVSNFFGAATFPLIVGFFRFIYKKVYRLK